MEDAVGGKGEGVIGKGLPAPAADLVARAPPRRRIYRVELRGHELKRRARQAGRERAGAAPRVVDENDVVALLDARRREHDLTEHAQRDRHDRGEPRRKPRRHRPRHDEHGRDHEQRVAEEVVDGQPQRRDHEHQRGELEPRLHARRRGAAIIGMCGVQCSAPGFAGRYPLASSLSKGSAWWPSAARHIRSAPSPLVGEGWGGGAVSDALIVPHRTTPTPNPSPQGGGERTESVESCYTDNSLHRRLPMPAVLALYEDVLSDGAALALPAAARMIFLVHGGATVAGRALRDGEAWHGEAAATLVAGGAGATCWRFDFASPPAGAPAGVTSRQKLAVPLATLPAGERASPARRQRRVPARRLRPSPPPSGAGHPLPDRRRHSHRHRRP